MSAREQKIRRHGVLPTAFMPAGNRLLQRRHCACGGASGMTGTCQQCGQRQLGGPQRAAHEQPVLGGPSRLPGGAHAPQSLPISSAFAFTEPHLGHDFGRVKVRDSDTAVRSSFRPAQMFNFSEQAVEDDEKPAVQNAPLSADGAQAGRDDDSELRFITFNSNAGEATCDIETGQMTGETNTSNCTSPCTARHEAKHVADVGPCCQKAAKAYKKATTDEAKQGVSDKAKKWGEDNRAYLECRAYTESVACADEKKKAQKCDEKEPVDEGCCALLRAYRRKMLSMKSYYCDPKPKSTACPFP